MKSKINLKNYENTKISLNIKYNVFAFNDI